METNVFAGLFERDLNKLQKEITDYSNEALLWKTEGAISNSAGNLCLHLVGNLKHFVGKILGGIDYVREREKEFSDKDVPVAQLSKMVEETKDAVVSTIQKLNAEDLDKMYPQKVFENEMTTGQFLLHLYGHLNYHLGQINYHRRLIKD